MAGGEYGKVFKRVWGDPDFKSLTASQQLLYIKLVSQPDVSLAGVITFAPRRWVAQTADVTSDALDADLAYLCERRYLVIDDDTQELLIRSYVRNDESWKSPRTMIGIGNAVERVLSDMLRGVISTELQRLDTDGLPTSISDKTGRSSRDVVVGILDRLIAENPPCGTPIAWGIGRGIRNSQEGVSDGVSHGVSDTPSEGVSHGVSGVRALTCTCKNTCTCTCKSNLTPTELGATLSDGDDDRLPVPLVENSTTADAAAPKKGRGHRLPDGWTPSRSDANLRVESGHGSEWLTDQLGRFRDHWAAQPGAKGVKADWDATWRNWIKRAADYAPKGTRPRTFGQMTDDDWAADIAAAKARIA